MKWKRLDSTKLNNLLWAVYRSIPGRSGANTIGPFLSNGFQPGVIHTKQSWSMLHSTTHTVCVSFLQSMKSIVLRMLSAATATGTEDWSSSKESYESRRAWCEKNEKCRQKRSRNLFGKLLLILRWAGSLYLWRFWNIFRQARLRFQYLALRFRECCSIYFATVSHSSSLQSNSSFSSTTTTSSQPQLITRRPSNGTPLSQRLHFNRIIT